MADAVDDAKVKAAYDKQVAAFKPAPEFNASHILVDSEDKAKALKAEIDGGKDFAEVAKANSSDGSAANGGDLGWFGAGQMVPEFETAVSAMQVGAVSAPVKTQFGWHIIKLNDKRETTPPTLDAAAAARSRTSSARRRCRPSWSSSAPRRRSSGRTPARRRRRSARATF